MRLPSKAFSAGDTCFLEGHWAPVWRAPAGHRAGNQADSTQRDQKYLKTRRQQCFLFAKGQRSASNMYVSLG